MTVTEYLKLSGGLNLTVQKKLYARYIESRLRPFSSEEQEFISNLRKELNMSEENFEKVWVL